MNRLPVLVAADLPTPVGRLVVVSDGRAVCALEFEDFSERMHRLLRRRFGTYEIGAADPLGVVAKLERYFDGDAAALDDIAVAPGGTDFQRRVWQALRTIPFGQTRTYAQIAAQIGGTHARAVGQANALNPVAIVVPCHRVIGANAALTGYAGGLARKRWLLDLEARRETLLLPLG